MASYEQNRSAVVTAARSGGMSRRGFLSAMLALGVDAPEAARELAPKLISIPKPRRERYHPPAIWSHSHQPFRDAFVGSPAFFAVEIARKILREHADVFRALAER